MERKPLEPISLAHDWCDSFVRQNERFAGEPLVLERTENSDLVGVARVCTQEFFDEVFAAHGPFWDTYADVGLAVRPLGASYAAFPGGRLFFLKNTENEFMLHGLQKRFSIKKQALLSSKLSLENLFFFLAAPVDAVIQLGNMIVAGFLVNAELSRFEQEKKNAQIFEEAVSKAARLRSGLDSCALACESLRHAVACMRYSCLAELAHVFHVRLKSCAATKTAELSVLSDMLKKNVRIEQKSLGSAQKKFGFFSLWPYDISFARFSEEKNVFALTGLPVVPSIPALVWRENSKFLCARYLALQRVAYQEVGKASGIGDLVFHLRTAELSGLFTNKAKRLVALAQKRQAVFNSCVKVDLPNTIVLSANGAFGVFSSFTGSVFSGQTVSARTVVSGQVIVVNEPADYRRVTPGCVIVSKTLSPNLSSLFSKAVAVVTESGGSLSHAAIVAREMAIPCIVQAVGVSRLLAGMFVEVDGKTGKVRLIKENPVVSVTSRTGSQKPALPSQKSSLPIHLSHNPSVHSTSSSVPSVLFFGDSRLSSVLGGGKASALSRLSSVVPVPRGFCIPVPVLQRLLGDCNPSPFPSASVMRKKIVGLEFPFNLEKELRSAWSKLRKPVVVRSSALFEDSEAASAAGQLDSFLDVSSFSEFLNAIKNCWASYYNDRAISYREQRAFVNLAPVMGVVVQEFIEPVCSGVLFTESPNNASVMLVEVVPGRAEGLVSGRKNPVQFCINRRSLDVTTGTSSLVSVVRLQKLARLALKIETVYRCAQDIEWCLDRKGKLWIVQARAITA